ncbi:MAG: beta(1,3)galactosyltransferase EpsH [Clostridium sp.]|nr:beta(1,3)galactosyltransferase EpsH [Clostridium sp.]
MIFITLGSQKFQFDRLLIEIDRLIEKGIISDKVYAQIGYCNYIPKNFEYTKFLNRDEFSFNIDKSDIVITHAGTGVIVNAVKKGKKVIAVPRLVKYGEHVDDHQIQIIKQFKELNLICGLDDCSQLEQSLLEIYNKKFDSYISNTQKYINEIDKYIMEVI